MKISDINYSVIFDALKAYYEVEEAACAGSSRV